MRANADKRSIKTRIAETVVFLVLLCIAGLFAKGRYEKWYAQQPYPVALAALQELAETVPEAELTEANLDENGFPRSDGSGYVFSLRDENGKTIGEIELAAVDEDILKKPLYAFSEARGKMTVEILGSDESSFAVEDHGFDHTWTDTEGKIFPGKVGIAGVSGLFTDRQILPGEGYTLVKAQEDRYILTVDPDEDEAGRIRAIASEELVRTYDAAGESVTALEMTEPLFLEEDEAVVFVRSSHGPSDDAQEESDTCYYLRCSKSNNWAVRSEAKGESSVLEYTDEDIFEVPPYAEPPKNTAKDHTYYIMVNREMNTVTVFTKDENGNFTVPYKAMICSTGREGHETPVGDFSILNFKAEWCYMIDGSYGQYAVGFRDGGYLFHSVCYTQKDRATMMADEYNMLGDFASAGCVRLQVADAKWIFDNCEVGTGVTVYDSPEAGALGKPAKAVEAITEENDNGWDPTDPEPYNPWHTSN